MLADVISPNYFSPSGLFVSSVGALGGIVLIEGIVLCILRWGSWHTAFLHAFIVNLISYLLGTGLIIFASQQKLDYLVPPLALVLGAFLLTVAVETVALKALRPSSSLSRTLLSSFVANFFSYLFLLVMISLAFVFPLFGYGNRPIPHPRPTPFVSPGPSASPNA